MRRAAAFGAMVALALAGSSVGAVGLDGSGLVDRRATVTIGGGLDRVGGYAQDTYPLAEVGGSYEAVVWKRLTLGVAASFRLDLDDYNDALGRWRHQRSPALAVQAWVGYDGPGFHISAGPWLYGAARERPNFWATVLPYGVLRLRFGHQDSWHFNVHVADGAPFTAEGAALALRLMVGAPVRGRHRMSGGLYTSIGETTVGLAFTDEIAGAGPLGTSLRWGGTVGTDLGMPSRPELTGFVGSAW